MITVLFFRHLTYATTPLILSLSLSFSLSLSHSLSFSFSPCSVGAVFLKTWRMYKIFTNKLFYKQVKLTDQ